MVIFVARQRTAWMYLLLVVSVKPHFSSVPGPGVVQFQFSAWNGRTMQVLYASPAALADHAVLHAIHQLPNRDAIDAIDAINVLLHSKGIMLS